LSEDDPNEKSCFLGSSAPPITILDYVERLVRYVNQWAEDEPSPTSTGIRCLLLAVEYLERANLKITSRSVHRFVMCGVLLAVKFTEDFAISNKFWGEVGGCKLDDVNRMEAAFCQLLEWRFDVSSKGFAARQSQFVYL